MVCSICAVYLFSVLYAWLELDGWAFVLSCVSGALLVFWFSREGDASC